MHAGISQDVALLTPLCPRGSDSVCCGWKGRSTIEKKKKKKERKRMSQVAKYLILVRDRLAVTCSFIQRGVKKQNETNKQIENVTQIIYIRYFSK